MDLEPIMQSEISQKEKKKKGLFFKVQSSFGETFYLFQLRNSKLFWGPSFGAPAWTKLQTRYHSCSLPAVLEFCKALEDNI